MRTRPGCSGSLPDHRMILELAEAPREGDVLGARDVLVAQEQHLVLEQQRLDFAEQPHRRAKRRRGLTPNSSAPMLQVSCSTRMRRFLR